MPLKKPTGEEIYEFRKKDLSLTWAEVGEFYAEPPATLRKRELRYRKKNHIPPLPGKKKPATKDPDLPPGKDTHKVKFTDRGFSATAYSTSSRISSLDGLLEACNADLSKWQVSRHLVNVWEGGRKKKIVDLTWTDGRMDGYVEDTGEYQLTDLFQVKAWFEPRTEEPYEKALEALIERVKNHAPVYDPSSFVYKPVDFGYLLVPNLYDAHFGKRSQRSIKYSLEEARDDFIRISEAIVSQVSSGRRKPSRIMFPVGHDLLHVDSLLDKTTHGTWVETSYDLRDAIDAACEATAKSIEAFATVAPVDVVPVEGNHDRLQTYWLGKYLQAFFSNHPKVRVYDMKLERQYYQWGRVGLGLTHDGKSPQQLATLFPVEAREMWADIEWSEWLTGHFHHQRGALYAVDSIRGTVVRTISALCNMDNYHSLHLYAGVHRAADVLYYHNENGPAGSFPVFVSEL
jgi:hypothetical protein